MVDILKRAKEVIAIQEQGVRSVETILDEKFVHIIEKLATIKGRIIVSGIGKSGHIARKIAATMASIGTPASFVHPTEASHGDLGMITKDDAVILLSNSGETKELSDIINYCKRQKIFLLGMVRRKSSMLVSAADHSFILPEIAEASVVNAPTTSTTMMLVLGDIIAIILSEQRGFTKGDFGVFHPGGKIGSQFTLVSTIMRQGAEIPLINSDSSIDDAIATISKKGLGIVAVVKENGELAGVITDGDLRRNYTKIPNKLKLSDIMSVNPITISKDELAQAAVALMQSRKITVIFVIEDKKPLGVVSIHDCFRSGIL